MFPTLPPVVLLMSARLAAGFSAVLIFGGAADAFVFGMFVFAAAPFDWSGLTGLAVAVGGILSSLYGIYNRSEDNRKRIIDLEASTAAALEKAHDAERQLIASNTERATMKDEILRLRQGQHDIRGTQAEIKYAQMAMKEDLAATRSMTPDPDHPMPVVVVNPPQSPANVTMPHGGEP